MLSIQSIIDFLRNKKVSPNAEAIDQKLKDFLSEIDTIDLLKDFEHLYDKKHLLLTEASRVMDTEQMQNQIDNAINQQACKIANIQIISNSKK